MWLRWCKMWKSNVMNIFHIIFHGLAQWSHTTRYSNFVIRHHFSQFPFWMLKKLQNKSFPCVTKNVTGQHRYCHAEVLSWAIKHFDFHKLSGLWLARLINNHARIYESNVAQGFSAFQHRSCSVISYASLLNQKCVPCTAFIQWIIWSRINYKHLLFSKFPQDVMSGIMFLWHIIILPHVNLCIHTITYIFISMDSSCKKEYS